MVLHYTMHSLNNQVLSHQSVDPDPFLQMDQICEFISGVPLLKAA